MARDAEVAFGSRATQAACARRVFEANKRLRERLGGGLAIELAMDLLLYLLAQPKPASTQRCCAALSVPLTTALRWLSALSDSGLVIQRPAKDDPRLTLLSVSDTARDALAQWLAAVTGDATELGQDR